MSREHFTSAAAAAASSYAASSAAASSASSSAAAPQRALQRSGYKWPWVARHEHTDVLLDEEDRWLPDLPTKASLNLPKDIAKFDIGLAKGDRRFHDWNTFNDNRGNLFDWLSSPDRYAHHQCATQYHDLGKALMKRTDRELRYAIKAFEREYAISCTLPNATFETIAGLRKLAECHLELHEYSKAARYAEQTLTNAVQSHHWRERLGAMTTLGRIAKHWFDTACSRIRKDEDSEDEWIQSAWGLLERQELLQQTLKFFKRAQLLAERIPAGVVDKPEQVLRASLDLAKSLQLPRRLRTFKNAQERRLLELKKELAEPPSALYTPQLQTDAELCAALTRIDLSPFAPSHPFDSFKLSSPSSLALGTEQSKPDIELAWKSLDKAEKLCFEDPIDAVEWRRTPLAELGLTWEIDERTNGVPDRVRVDSHSSVLHAYGTFFESTGFLQEAISKYLAAVRRLNCLRGPAALAITPINCSAYTKVVDDQCVSLKAAMSLYLRLGQYDGAHSMACQWLKLSAGAKKLLKAHPIPRVEWKNDVIHAKKMVHRIKQQKDIQTKLAACNSDNDPALTLRYALFTRRRKLFTDAVKDADDGLDDSKQAKGFNVQGMLDAEREMWRIVRTQRKRLHPQRDPAEWAASLSKEGHLIISIAQSVCTMSDLLFADSPVKQMERQLCDKYWLLARQWQQRVLPPVVGRSFPEWEGKALIEHAQALHDLRDNEQTVLNLRLEAWDQLKFVTDPLTRARLLFARKCLAESIVDTLKLQAARSSATQAKRASYVEWKSIFDALSAEWTTLTEATDAASALRVHESENMDAVFEGREMPAMGDKSAAGEDSSPLSEAEDEAEVVRSLVRPPSSKPIPALADPHSATAAAASRAPKAAGPSNGQNSIQGFMGSSAASAAAASSVAAAAAPSAAAFPARTAPRGTATTRAAPASSSDLQRKRRRIANDDDEMENDTTNGL